jgi:hypothetical protein
MIYSVRRVLSVALVAAMMAVVGYGLLVGGTVLLQDGLTSVVVGVSVVLWLFLAAVIQDHAKCGKNGLSTAIGFGLLSPLIGGAFFGPLALMLLVIKWYISFPVGAVTGVLVWACVTIGRAGRPDQAKHAPELAPVASPAFPEPTDLKPLIDFFS